ncbi:MAG: 2-hydroxyacyl-CoA dehydratase [Clostridia bacterium]|nr:2-hydroxyacyl-CoA dehydratase [Clostridia bacterium]
MDSEKNYPVFTEEMKKTHTILIPMMLPIHFALMAQVLRQHGYKAELLTNESRSVVEEGLKYVHNDTCYPALLVIGQFIDALKSGKYDPDKTALMITQTGGGCRASNYIFLLRKALKKSGFENAPVISLNFAGLDESPGFKMTLPLAIKFVYAAELGDFLMLLYNQCKPYEIKSGDTDRVVQKWTDKIIGSWSGKKIISYKKIKKSFTHILRDFDAIPKTKEKKIKVGIVGEIYVKYSPMGNNHLEDFLRAEGAETVVPGLMDFCMYSLYNGIVSKKLYGGGALGYLASKIGYKFFLKKQKYMIQAIKKHGVFDSPMDFSHTTRLAGNYINHGVKMGEGWLLTVEMAELISKGVYNVVCAQPFGCLPNHIAGKGMMNEIKAKHPMANLIAIDYDPGASEVNQQNRIKMMLANAKIPQEQEEETTHTVHIKEFEQTNINNKEV